MNIGTSNECGVPAIQLNNGIKIPQVGLGTFLIPKEKLSRTIAQAYEMGYRQFDTAWRYHNEADIAKALKENGINRQDVFITIKVNVDALYLQNYRYGYHSIFKVMTVHGFDILEGNIPPAEELTELNLKGKYHQVMTMY